MTRALGLPLLLLATACGLPATTRLPPAPTPKPTSVAEAHWLDDPETAFQQARAQQRLVLVDLWAPWCHTCLSMQAEVLHARAVPELSRLVLLQVDTERDGNAEFLSKYPVAVWPTFYVIDPKGGAVRGRFLGGASPEQLGHFLRDALGEATGALAQLRAGDVWAAEKSWPEAEAAYRAALAEAPAGWKRRPDALVALISALLKQKHYDACLELAKVESKNLTPSVSAVDFAASAATCAERLPQAPHIAAVRQQLEALLAPSCEARAPGASADDQADACGNLRDVRSALGNRAGAEQAAERALAAIAAASAGKPPEIQLIYDWERTSSLAFLGRTEQAIELLRERERQLPSSYNPPHYLARLYRDTRAWQSGLEAIERALDNAYGPRRAGFLGVKAELLRGAGRGREALAVLEQQLAAYRALPESQRSPDTEATVEERLVELSATLAPPPFTCAARMTVARAELLAAGFSPAKDTSSWLQVRGLTDGGLTLHVHTIYTPDGDGLRSYDAEIHPYKGKPFAWRLKQQNLLDEFKEERLPERTWTTARAGWIAKVHTRTEETKWVELFESTVRPALEDCLAHPGQQGVLERCEYSEQQSDWVCKTW